MAFFRTLWRAVRMLRRASAAAPLARWRLIHFAALVLGVFVALNGVTGLIDDHAELSSRLAGAAVVAMGVAVWWGVSRLAGTRPA